jgi:hypothetical protein
MGALEISAGANLERQNSAGAKIRERPVFIVDAGDKDELERCSSKKQLKPRLGWACIWCPCRAQG